MAPVDTTAAITRDVLEPILSVQVERGPEHSWEGMLKGAHGSARHGKIAVKAVIAFHGDLAEGRGHTDTFPSDIPGGVDFTLTGSIHNGRVRLEVWFDEKDIGRQPFTCDGEINEAMTKMSGDWTCPCFYPDSCDCGGGGGGFTLKRVG